MNGSFRGGDRYGRDRRPRYDEEPPIGFGGSFNSYRDGYYNNDRRWYDPMFNDYDPYYPYPLGGYPRSPYPNNDYYRDPYYEPQYGNYGYRRRDRYNDYEVNRYENPRNQRM